jgi:hypothetical protein
MSLSAPAALRFVGAFWSAAILVSTIGSAFFPGGREFISSLSILPFLLMFWAALSPGVIMLVLSEKMSSGSA